MILQIISKEVDDKFLEWLIATPKALMLLICSFFSGQLWFFVIVTYLKNGSKGNTYLKNRYAKTTLGFLWFCIINLPIHYLRIGFEFNYDNIFESILYTIVYGFVLQGTVFLAIVTFKKER